MANARVTVNKAAKPSLRSQPSKAAMDAVAAASRRAPEVSQVPAPADAPVSEAPKDSKPAKATDPYQGVDGLQRVIRVRKLTALDRMRLFEFISNDKAGRDRWMGLAILACSVSVIDGDDCPLPATEREIEVMVKRLGDEGLATAGELLMRLNGVSDGEIEKIKNS